MSGEKEKNEVNTFTLTIILLGIFPAMFGAIWYGSRTFISIDSLFESAIVLGAAVFLLHLPLRRRMNRYMAEMVFYSFAGWGVILLCLLLMLNYHVHGQPETLYYRFPGNQAIYVIARPLPIVVDINDPELTRHRQMRSFEQSEIKSEETASEAAYTEAHGLLGYKILLRKELH